MTDKPFEVVAEITLQGLPTSGDIARIGEDVERARRGAPAVVRATLAPPARFREGGYCLEARFAAWAADGPAAVAAVEGVLRAAGLAARTVHLSGRALAPGDVPPPEAQAGKAAGGRGAGASRPRPRRAGAARGTAAAPRGRGAGATRPTAQKGGRTGARRRGR